MYTFAYISKYWYPLILRVVLLAIFFILIPNYIIYLYYICICKEIVVSLKYDK